jgi:hypothetical protein
MWAPARSEDRDPAAGLEDAARVGEERGGVSDVLEYRLGEEEVERGVGERKPLRLEIDAMHGGRSGELWCRARPIHSRDVKTEARERGEVVASAGSEVEQRPPMFEHMLEHPRGWVIGVLRPRCAALGILELEIGGLRDELLLATLAAGHRVIVREQAWRGK